MAEEYHEAVVLKEMLAAKELKKNEVEQKLSEKMNEKTSIKSELNEVSDRYTNDVVPSMQARIDDLTKHLHNVESSNVDASRAIEDLEYHKIPRQILKDKHQ